MRLRYLLIPVFFTLALVVGCGSNDSSTGSGSDTTYSATKDCGSTDGGWCQGGYSTSSSDDAIWSGVCMVRQIDSGEWTYLWFHHMTNCGFDWIRSQGTVGSDWATLAAGTATEFMVQHTGEEVFQLRRCEDGGNKTNDGCL